MRRGRRAPRIRAARDTPKSYCRARTRPRRPHRRASEERLLHRARREGVGAREPGAASDVREGRTGWAAAWQQRGSRAKSTREEGERERALASRRSQHARRRGSRFKFCGLAPPADCGCRPPQKKTQFPRKPPCPHAQGGCSLLSAEKMAAVPSPIPLTTRPDRQRTEKRPHAYQPPPKPPKFSPLLAL